MSQASAYLILAQLNTIMTGCLRLGIGFLGLTALAGLMGLKRQSLVPLGRYFSAWMTLSSLCGLFAAIGAWLLLPQPNPFVAHGLVLALILLPAGLGLTALQGPQRGTLWRLGLSLAAAVGLGGCLAFPSFSRSGATLVSSLLDLPLGLALAYFPLGMLPRLREQLGPQLHRLWLAATPVSLLLHYFWLWPRLAGIPQQGEFYPFINLFDWFLAAAMILYLGNLYIDYWLRLGSHRSILALSWNYLVLIATVLCLWLNANVFDTLAL